MMRIYFVILLLSLNLLRGEVFAQEKIVVLTYNVLHGFQQKDELKEKFVKWVKGIHPDIVAFQELNNFTQASLEKFAQRYEHPYAVILQEGNTGIGLTSRYPITNVAKVLDGMNDHGFIYAKVRQYHLFVIYLTPTPKNFQKRQSEIDSVLARAGSMALKENTILLGDFNSFSPLDSTLYQQTPEERPEFRALKNGKPDFQVVQSIMDAGYTDAFRWIHNTSVTSFPTAGYQKEKPHRESRLDYIWLSKPLLEKCIRADIIKDNVTDSLSDHYPVIIELKK